MASITEIRKSGSKRDVELDGVSAAQLDSIDVFVTERHGVVTVHCNNKREFQQVQELVTALNDAPVVARRANAAEGRYIERLETAERHGLNHGKPWIADGHTIDRLSLDPSMEGEWICYVYPN